MLTQKLQLRLQQDVITGFSYSFTKALLEKLKALKMEDRIFGAGEARANAESYFWLTPIASSVIDYLCEQLKGVEIETKEVGQLISRAEEFLSIFEKEE